MTELNCVWLHGVTPTGMHPIASYLTKKSVATKIESVTPQVVLDASAPAGPNTVPPMVTGPAGPCMYGCHSCSSLPQLVPPSNMDFLSTVLLWQSFLAQQGIYRLQYKHQAKALSMVIMLRRYLAICTELPSRPGQQLHVAYANYYFHLKISRVAILVYTPIQA